MAITIYTTTAVQCDNEARVEMRNVLASVTVSKCVGLFWLWGALDDFEGSNIQIKAESSRRDSVGTCIM